MATEPLAADASLSPLRMRSIHGLPPTDAELRTCVAHRAKEAPPLPPESRGVGSDSKNNDNEDTTSSSEEFGEEAMDPIQLPQSTHSLLFSEPVDSSAFWFGAVISIISFTCLGLTLVNNIETSTVPSNVTRTVRTAQYLSILIALLMEEEIPTGFYLLRMIPRQSLHQKFPRMMYRKFIFSSIVRILSGYAFLINVLLVLRPANSVIDIFYDVLALQFVQQLDDIAFSLAKIDVFGKELQRACTAKCFHAIFDKHRLGKIRKLSTFLKTIYFVNICGMLGGMLYVTVNQVRGNYHQSSIEVDFGNTVWDSAWVHLSSGVPPWVRTSPLGEYASWTLVYSYFNGVYSIDRMENGRPVYKEMRKFDATPFGLVKPAEIKYCDDIQAWVFRHESITRSKNQSRTGCNWLLRSPETTEYDLLEIVGNWQVWVGIIGKAEVSVATNSCSDEDDCNMNGDCINDKCVCKHEDGVEHLGSHCEVSLKDSCQAIIGERETQAFVTMSMSFLGGSDDKLFQEYSRPVYYSYYEMDDESYNPATIMLVYSGNRWFGSIFPDTYVENMTLEENLVLWSDYHAFWYQAYSVSTQFVSDPTSGSTPVGVDFYWIGERGDQFGPFGSLIPLQLYNQTGRGVYRCNGTSAQNVFGSMFDRGQNNTG